ncbi:zinc finger protein ZFMSA12A-like isoform X3 [Achroia grisella]|uniref:zinc finger protein ZFMSA12A-like isoform X3 n=1 Tax=Achroia grisella TaxID=688607 RepID=UPI0027D2F7CB|nr:zinc finger protein ZFMSA12A-like isoform X3 [Achroia grisella]
MAAKTMEWRPGPTVCRCCLAEGCYKDISTEYFWMGKREVYSEMLSETFSVSIAYSTAGGPNSNSRLICEPCISRLRDASDFKRQVQECERTFMQHLDPGSTSTAGCELTVEPEDVKIETVKLEAHLSDVDVDDGPDFGDDDDDDLDDEPLTKFATKVPKKESVDLLDLIDNSKAAEKRKSTTKVKATPAKKTKKETVKPTSSKPKPEKKKKGEDSLVDWADVELRKVEETRRQEERRKLNDELKMRRRHAMVLLENSKICPFRWMKNLYLCFYCEQQFSDPVKLREHNTAEHPNQNCSEIKDAMSKLKKYELIKVDITNVSCKLCEDNVTDLHVLKTHLLLEHKLNIDPKSKDGVLPFRVSQYDFPCALCVERYADFKSLNHHMNVHFQNFICEQCGTGFMTPERLRTHAFSHETGSFACDSCDKVFRSTNAKNEHFATVHLQVKRHRCPHCSETFRNYFQRNKHISSVHGLKLKEFKCNMCPRVFNLSGKLGLHIKTVHLKMKRHTCDVCEWKFYSKSELKDHMVRHGGERKYKCSVCKKAYARKYTLREHMRIHENDRRFVCSICGTGFVQNCSLKHHTKVHHPNAVSDSKVSCRGLFS